MIRAFLLSASVGVLVTAVLVDLVLRPVGVTGWRVVPLVMVFYVALGFAVNRVSGWLARRTR